MKKRHKLWNKFISSDILPMILCGMVILAMFSSLSAIIIFSIKSILTMIGVI